MVFDDFDVPFWSKIHFWRPLLKMSPQIFPRDLVFDIYLFRPTKEIIKSRPARAGSRARDPARGGGGPPPSPLNLLDLLDLIDLADLLDLLDPKQSTPQPRSSGSFAFRPYLAQKKAGNP